jgi:excisionase family DNA binding protein
MSHEDAQYKPGESASQLLSINEVTDRLAISRDTFYRVIAREVPTYRVGQRIRVRASDLDAYVEAHRESE